MKFQKLNIVSLIVLVLILFSSCKKDDSSNITDIVVNGNWKISLFQEDGSVKTSDYSGYSFIFNSNNTISATKNSLSTNGTWSSGNDDSKSKLVINFGSVSPLDELNEDWEILEKSSSIIKLKHISGGDGSIDYLNFEKN